MSGPEQTIVNAVIRELDRRRIPHWNISAGNGETGLPDRLAVLPGGRLLAIECKTATGRVAPKQQWWIDRLNTAGALAIVVRHIDQLRLVLDFYLDDKEAA